MINPKENLAASAFDSIYGWSGHREGKIIALLMGQLLSTKLPLNAWRKTFQVLKNPAVIIKSSEKHSLFSNKQNKVLCSS